MAKKEGYIIDLNKLWRYEDGNLIRPRMLWANGKEYFAAFSNGFTVDRYFGTVYSLNYCYHFPIPLVTETTLGTLLSFDTIEL